MFEELVFAGFALSVLLLHRRALGLSICMDALAPEGELRGVGFHYFDFERVTIWGTASNCGLNVWL